MICPCGSQKDFSQCCETYLQGKASPPTAEAMMRSRYTAFTQCQMDYIIETTDPQTRQLINKKANEEWARNSEFLGLEIIRQSEEGTKGTVEFKARYRGQDGQESVHHEVSKFRKQAGTWYFREGKILTESAGS